MLFEKISPKAVVFIEEHLKGMYTSDNGSERTYRNYEPYQTHDPSEYPESDFYIYLTESLGGIKCAVEICLYSEPETSELLDNPAHFIGLLMKCHPNRDLYGCEQKSNWHDRLQDELRCSTNTRPKRAKI